MLSSCYRVDWPCGTRAPTRNNTRVCNRPALPPPLGVSLFGTQRDVTILRVVYVSANPFTDSCTHSTFGSGRASRGHRYTPTYLTDALLRRGQRLLALEPDEIDACSAFSFSFFLSRGRRGDFFFFFCELLKGFKN